MRKRVAAIVSAARRTTRQIPRPARFGIRQSGSQTAQAPLRGQFAEFSRACPDHRSGTFLEFAVGRDIRDRYLARVSSKNFSRAALAGSPAFDREPARRATDRNRRSGGPAAAALAEMEAIRLILIPLSEACFAPCRNLVMSGRKLSGSFGWSFWRAASN
jgi:hypothetical protein